MKRYYPPIAANLVLYALNRFCLIPLSDGIVHRILSGYAADFLAGALMLCILNILLELTGRRPLSRYGLCTLFLIACGLFWEYITPLYLARSVSDPWDIFACWLGGSVLYQYWKHKEKTAP